MRAVTYIYLAGPGTGVRIIWDPPAETFTQDATWTPACVSPGEMTGDAPIPLGDWIIFNSNAGAGATVPQCIVAVSRCRGVAGRFKHGPTDLSVGRDAYGQRQPTASKCDR